MFARITDKFLWFEPSETVKAGGLLLDPPDERNRLLYELLDVFVIGETTEDADDEQTDSVAEFVSIVVWWLLLLKNGDNLEKEWWSWTS